MLSDGDRQWLEGKFTSIHHEIKEQGSKVHKLESKVFLIEAGSPHKCDESIKAHEDGSWSHNPKKAIGLGASLLALVEGARAFFHK